MKKNTFLSFVIILLFNSVNAQVLYNETFDNYTIGNLGTDPDGKIPGNGGWITKCFYTKSNSVFTIVNETNRGKVLDLTSPISSSENFIVYRTNLSTLVDNRLTGNDVIKVEIDYYTGPITPEGTYHSIEIEPIGVDPLGINNALVDFTFHKEEGSIGIFLYNNRIVDNLKGYKLPFNTWISLIFYLDYTNRKGYAEIPFLNKVLVGDFLKDVTSSDLMQDFKVDSIVFQAAIETNKLVTYTRNKYDNIKITALKEVPPSVLSTNSFLSESFNLYPNPATNIVNITNNDNMFVNQVQVYDLSGKLINTQNFTNETETQLNVETLKSGTYLLHLQTDQGIAVKKLIKK